MRADQEAGARRLQEFCRSDDIQWGEVNGLELRDPDAVEGLLAKFWQAPCLLQLEHLEVTNMIYGSIALSAYLNAGAQATSLTKLSLRCDNDILPYEDGAQLMLALAAGMCT